MVIVQEISLLPNKSSQSMYIRTCHGKTAKVGGCPPLAYCFPYNWDATELQAFDPHSTLRCGKNEIRREGFLYQKICLFRAEPEFVALIDPISRQPRSLSAVHLTHPVCFIRCFTSCSAVFMGVPFHLPKPGNEKFTHNHLVAKSCNIIQNVEIIYIYIFLICLSIYIYMSVCMYMYMYIHRKPNIKV